MGTTPIAKGRPFDKSKQIYVNADHRSMTDNVKGIAYPSVLTKFSVRINTGKIKNINILFCCFKSVTWNVYIYLRRATLKGPLWATEQI